MILIEEDMRPQIKDYSQDKPNYLQASLAAGVFKGGHNANGPHRQETVNMLSVVRLKTMFS